MRLADFSDHFRRRFPTVVGDSVLVALSGGADSVALLHLMCAPELDLDLQAAYVDHGERPEEVPAEIEYCRRLCAGLDVPFHLIRLSDTTEGADLGREAMWRTRRYAALLELAGSLGLHTVATAHQRDDVAEGVLVQLLRGCGPRALAGISETTPSGVVRPLLPWPRQAIEEWLVEHGIQWCEDSSNRSPRHLRNRVRHQVLPQLEGISPSVRNHLVNLASALAEDEAHLAEELGRRARWIDPWHPWGSVPLEDVASLPPPLRSRWLHAQARRVGLDHVSRRQLVLFSALVESSEPRSVGLDQRWHLRLARRRLWLEPPTAVPAWEERLSVGRTVDLPIPGWHAVMRDGTAPPPPDRLSWQAPDGPAVFLRSGRPGDVIVDAGATIKLGAMLAKHLPRHLRRAWPVVGVGDTIDWIPGVWQGTTVGSPRTRTVEVYRR